MVQSPQSALEHSSPAETQQPRFKGGQMGDYINALDWSKTPVGSVETWPQSLKSLVKTLLASRYPMLLAWGPDFTQFYNDAYSQLIGDKHPAALGIDLRITLAEAWDTLGPMIETVMATGVANWLPALLLVLERSGYREESYFSVSHAPAEDDSGQIVGMLAVCSEVTQQVLGERRLRLLRDLASKAGGMRSVETICLDIAAAITAHPLDLPFAILYLRESDGKALTLRATVGLAEDESILPRSIDLASDNSDAWSLTAAAAGETVLLQAIDRHIAVSGGPWNEPVHSALAMPIASSGQTAPLGVLVAGISPNRALDEDYRSFYELLAAQVSILVRNAQAYEEERQRAEALAELDRAKTTFFSNISHEFRTPLTLMLGPAEAALADTTVPLPPVQRDRIEMLHRNGLRLLKLVNTLLDFSRIQAGRIQACYEPTDLADLTRNLASVFRSAIEQAGLRLVVDCPPLPEPVYVDREMWEKIVLNLLSNAFKFTFAGEIAVRLSAKADYAELEIGDTGTGIPADQLPHLFERFYRVAGTQGRTYEGSGIGLALVQELVKQHGGQVSVDSTLGQGSTFTLKIPFGFAHLPLEHVNASSRNSLSTAIRASSYVEEALRWLPTSPEKQQTELGLLPTQEQPPNESIEPAIEQNWRILFVDDNADMRDYVQQLLAPHYQVEVAANGIEALACAQAQLPDLILSDVMMPGLDGFGLLAALRADAATCAVPIILLSARSGQEATVEGLEAGADDYLIKPFSAPELLARVRTHLELVRMRRETIATQERWVAEQAARVVAEQAQAIAETAQREAETANQLKDEFLATVSHELRTPLNAILGWAELLRQGNLEATRTTRALETIVRNARAQNRLIEDILDVSRIVTGKLELVLEPVEVVPTLVSVLENVRLTARSKDIELTSRVEPLAGLVWGDAGRLEQVFANLLDNALKFTRSGGQVQVQLERNGDRVVITICDTGVGIAPELLPYIFDRFRQGDGSTTRTYGGLGLGLAIVRHLVEAMHGKIIAQSAGVGQGATFTITLPSIDSIAADQTDIRRTDQDEANLP